jgi:uncharacterized membrane protein
VPEISDVGLARVLHVLGVVLWIGGVAFVTTVLLPAIRDARAPEEWLRLFRDVEHRFAAQARITTLIVGASGIYLVFRWDLWARFASAHFWWMHAMVLVWLVFAMMLFAFEPLVLDKWFEARAERDAEGTFRLVQRLHYVLLGVSLMAVLGAVAGSHGVL